MSFRMPGSWRCWSVARVGCVKLGEMSPVSRLQSCLGPLHQYRNVKDLRRAVELHKLRQLRVQFQLQLLAEAKHSSRSNFLPLLV